MLDWLTRLFRPDERGLFVFHDGRRSRVADPIEAWNSLLQSKTFSFEKHIPLLQDPEERLAAAQVTAGAVREAFKVPSVDKGGLSTAQCVTLLNSFLSWMEVQKKNSSPMLTSPPPTAPPSLADSLQPSASDSGSIATAQSSVSVAGPSTPCASC